MVRHLHPLASLLILAALLCSTPPARGRGQVSSPTVSITTVVTVLGPKYSPPPPVAKEDVIVYAGKTRLNVTAWVTAQGEKGRLQLAILIDNSVSPSLGAQFDDLRSFIVSQPKNTAVGIFYAANGTVQAASPFDTHHDAAAKKLRLPLGPSAGDSPSIYLSLSDLVSHWPSAGARREVLMIASGVDRLNPGPSDPYFRAAVEDVKKAGVVVHTVYAGGDRLGATFRGNIAQGNLDQITTESGGKSFFEGVSTPVAFAPFLNQLDMILRNQYWLTFTTARSTKETGELRSIQIRTEQHNAIIWAPKEVFVPGPRK
jgi:hypothetical protein